MRRSRVTLGPMKVATWNVNGIRSRHAEVVRFAAEQRPDVLCLQELKASPSQIPEPLTTLAEYWSFWHGKPGGYSGVSLHLLRTTFPKTPAFVHPHFDLETRMVEVDVGAHVYASVYVPNGGKDYPAKLEFLRQLALWAPAHHARGKRVILCGDLNVTRAPIDVHPTQRDERAICQRPEERALFEQLLAGGLVDVARTLAPADERAFTWWPAWRNSKASNIGWRLDYVLASPVVAARASALRVHREFGTSDHGPVVVNID